MSDKDDATEPKKKGKMRKIMMLGGALIVLIGGGAGAGLYAAKSGLVGGVQAAGVVNKGPKLVPKSEQKHPAGEDGKAGTEEAHSTGGPEGTGGDKFASNYYAMDKDFTANLQNSTHFIQVGIAISTPYDDSVIANLKTNDIAVRSAVLMTLGDTSEDAVFTSDGKKQLQARLVKAINDVLKQKEGFGGVSNVYFTNFVVQ